jgi:hypothetical protein
MGVYSLVIKGIFRQTLKRIDRDFDAVVVRAKFGNGKVLGYTVCGRTPGINTETDVFGSLEEVVLRLAICGRNNQTLYLDIPENNVVRLCEMMNRTSGGDVIDA